MHEVQLHPEAVRAFRRLRGRVRDRIQSAIDDLAAEPRPHGAVKLAGRDDFRIRVGDYRIVYAVDDTERLVLVARIAHRREVYR
ncbi:MAG: type II toxin-antitoxin system RelE/ParE family toxin [Actinobacteria bacterium]|nr:type II toxin-antitoxin system RelE/ParE family toxin [Actinomycetota bacterium]